MQRQLALAAAWAFGLIASPGVLLAGPALLFEPQNGKVLYAEDIDNLWHPASLTKIMTAYLTFEALRDGRLKIDDKVQCSLVANLQPPSKIGLQVGGALTVDQALQSIIIKSANDVSVMLAEAIGGSEAAFVQKMNATAQRLGMSRTNFANANGLPDPAQVTTARDLAKLATAIVSEYPEHAHYFAMPDMRLGKQRLGSHNGLLRTFAGADGLKTGFTCDSGFNVVASATRDGHRLMAIVLGEATGGERAIRAASLLEHGFTNYGWKQVLNQSTIDNLPLDPVSQPVVSVRSSVLSTECGSRRRPALVSRNQTLKATVAASKAKRAAKKTDAAKKDLTKTPAPAVAKDPKSAAAAPPQGTPKTP